MFWNRVSVRYCGIENDECVYNVDGECKWREHKKTDLIVSRPGCSKPEKYMCKTMKSIVMKQMEKQK